MPDSRTGLQKVTSGVNKVFAGGKVGEAIGTLGGYGITAAKEKLGYVPKGTTAQYDLSAPNPLQVAGDIAKGATQIAGLKMPIAGSVLGKTAQFGALGGASGISSGVADGKSVGQTLKQGARDATVGALTGFTFGVLEKGVSATTRGISNLGGKIQYGVIKPSLDDVKDGFSVATLQKYNLGGNLQQTSQKTEAKLQDLTKQLNTKLQASNSSVNLDRVYDTTAKRLLGSKLESFGSNAQMEGAIEKLRNEIVAVAGKNGLVSIPEAQIVKRASGHYGAWTYGNPTPEATASQKVYNTFYNELKTAIEKNSPEGVREINKQMSELIPVMNAVIRRIPVAERNNVISLTDLISLTGASIEPTALSLALASRLQRSGKFGAMLSKAGGLGDKTLQNAERITRGIISR